MGDDARDVARNDARNDAIGGGRDARTSANAVVRDELVRD